MAKTLELQFGTELGRTATISVEDPKEPVDEEIVMLSMAQIIAADIFTSASGKFVTAKGARLVDRNVIEYELA